MTTKELIEKTKGKSNIETLRIVENFANTSAKECCSDLGLEYDLNNEFPVKSGIFIATLADLLMTINDQ